MDIKEKLDKLSALQMAIETNREYYNKLRMEALPEDVRTALDKIDAEFNDRQMAVGKEIDEITKEIKLDVVNLGSTVKGTFLMAVYNKGRISWDSDGLKGFMVAHPEISAFKKDGEPSVTIRKI